MNADSKQLAGLKQQAQSLLEKNELEKARDLFLEICQLDSNNANAWNILASLNGSTGRFEEAEECCRHALSLDEEHADAYFTLGLITGERGDLDASKKAIKRVVQLAPGNTIAWIILSGLYRRTGNWKEAEKSAYQAIAIDPDNVDAHYSLGMAQWKHGKVLKAKDSIEQLLTIEPEHPAGWKLLGDLEFMIGNIDSASECFRTALTYKPDDIDIQIKFAGSLLDFKHPTQAIDANKQKAQDIYEKISKQHPDNIPTRVRIAALYELQGQYEKARSCLQSLLNTNGDVNNSSHAQYTLAESWHHLGDILAEYGNKNEAVLCYERVIARHPDLLDVHVKLGKLYKKCAHHKLAIQHLDHAARLNIQDASVLVLLAELYLDFEDEINQANQRLHKAIEYGKCALAIDPRLYDAFPLFARALEKQGLFKKILDNNPFNQSPEPLEYQRDLINDSGSEAGINLMFFMVGDPLSRCARITIDSATACMDGVQVTQLSDPETAAVAGVNEVVRTTSKIDHLMFTRVRMYDAVIRNIRHDTVLVDSDVVIQKDLTGVFGDWDVALTVRDDSNPLFDVMPFNEGVIFCRPTEGARRFWNGIVNIYTQLPDYLRPWSGGQLSLGIACGEQLRSENSNLITIEGIKIKLLPHSLFNYTPEHDDEDLSDKYIVHYKGTRKKWMLSRSEAKQQ